MNNSPINRRASLAAVRTQVGGAHCGRAWRWRAITRNRADYSSQTLAACDPPRLHKPHTLIGPVSRPEHLDLFRKSIAENSLFGRCGKVHHNCADSPARRYRMECGKGAV
ncbi:malonate decarboxylase subunit alpha [Mycobacterium sp.]|jgi:Malonate decarboxylase, alpha subunit, transporter|uniref:malonate decarboxylase subunit alpha n=1 Tax=Mycobacterium sp. TaxID=1785 RepID=UPI002D0445CA|nr:malonate decarboxylase subunit alpha [Mycobacterium sp.]HTH89744.1 malonate decarboxylase subunit alpha [Mycobacterium sp.]